MSANRKLQGEVDKVLKKVDEGVELFDDIWDKVYSASQQTHKEKYEGDLKKEIKKLQRLRDQIKTWVSSNDIKDKTALVEARKLIESKMEQFKICEKETKTKAYSKEGLAREDKLDPREAEKEEKRNWIQSVLDRLTELVETLEGDIDKIASGKTKGKTKGDSLEKLENRISKNKWHMEKLDQIIRALDNDSIDPSALDGIKEDIDYYAESAGDDDGALGIDDEFNIYEELQLDAALAAAGSAASAAAADKAANPDALDEEGDGAPASDVVPAAVLSSVAVVTSAPTPLAATGTPDVAAAKPIEGEDQAKLIGAAKKGGAKPVGSAGVAVGKGAATAAPAQPSAVAAASKTVASAVKTAKQAAAQPAPVVASSAPSTNNAPVVAQAKSYAAVNSNASSAPAVASGKSSADAASTGSKASGAPAEKKPSTAQVTAETKKNGKVVDPQKDVKLESPSIPWNGLSTAVGAASKAGSTETGVRPGGLPPNSAATSAVVSGQAAIIGGDASQKAIPSVSAIPVVNNVAAQFGASSFSGHGYALQISQQPPQGQVPSATSGSNQSAIVTGPARSSEQSAQSGSTTVNKALKMSMFFTPPGAEFDNRPLYTPRNPGPTHPLFPTQPAPIIDSMTLYDRLQMDTLFFAFYYQQGTYQQYLSAKQLKKHSWRFHKKYMTWFQRHVEPKLTTDEFEEGTYVYFDYESGWCQRIKSEFKFEYSYLEDELFS